MRLLGLGLVLAGVSLVRPAQACGVSPRTPALRGAPVAEQENVPTDVVPVYDLGELDARGLEEALKFSLRPAAGETVTLVQELTGGHVALRPAAPLQPHTRYELRVTLSYHDDGELQIDESLAFTTGAGPRPAVAPEPLLAAQQYWFSHNGNDSAACDFWTAGACVGIPQGEMVEVHYLLPDGQRTGPFLHDGPFETDVHEYVIEGEVCLELRRRALNGALSEPTTTCGSDLPRVDLVGDAAPSCVETGAVARDGEYTTRQPGEEFAVITYRYNPEFPDSNPSGDARCGLALPGSGTVSPGWPLAALLLGALLRRRRSAEARR